MTEWVTKEQAVAAVFGARGSATPIHSAVDAIRAIPAPEPVGEEELVERGAVAICLPTSDVCDMSGVWELCDDDDKEALRAVFRTALYVVRKRDRREADDLLRRLHEIIGIANGDDGPPESEWSLDDPKEAVEALRREADEVREVLREVLRKVDGAEEFYGCVVLDPLTRAQTERAAQVKP